MAEIRWFEEAKDDYDSLDGSQKIQVDKGLERIKNIGMKSGKGLNGNLIGCREIKQSRIGLRIIFRENKTNDSIEIVEIITIGKREEKAVFKEAAKRIDK